LFYIYYKCASIAALSIQSDIVLNGDAAGAGTQTGAQDDDEKNALDPIDRSLKKLKDKDSIAGLKYSNSAPMIRPGTAHN